ncbi:MAG: hypothetical protein RLN82_02450 [Pseudomonadales bacterium]
MANVHTKILIALMLCLTAGTAFAQYLYRYTDENGSVVMNSTLPAEYAGKGYEILDASSGKLVQKVEPQEEDAAANVVYLSPDDKILLASYSSTEEIQAHLGRKTAGLRAEIANIRADIRTLDAELETSQAEVESLKDRGQEIPQETLDHIAELKESDAGLKAALERREQDLISTEQEYEEKAARFELLLSSEHR